MIGTSAMFMNGHPWPGGELVCFKSKEVSAVGHLTSYNDFVTRYLVRLANGRTAFVKIVDQSEVDQQWLRALARAFNHELHQRAIEGKLVVPSRESPYILHWRDVP